MEQGEDAFQIDSTMSLIVAPGTPAPIVQRLHDALRRAADSEGFTTHSRRAGNAKAWMEPADYKVWLQRDYDTWGRVIRDAGITPEPK